MDTSNNFQDFLAASRVRGPSPAEAACNKTTHKSQVEVQQAADERNSLTNRNSVNNYSDQEPPV